MVSIVYWSVLECTGVCANMRLDSLSGGNIIIIIHNIIVRQAIREIIIKRTEKSMDFGTIQ